MKEIAFQGLLANYKPHPKDGGGMIYLQLDDLQWHDFIASCPQMWTAWAAARLNEDASQGTGTGS